MKTRRIPNRNCVVALAVLLSVFSSTPVPTAAASDRRRYETRFATVSYRDENELFSFTRSIGSGISFLTDTPRTQPALLRQRVDRLTMRVMKILDMQPPDLHFSIFLYDTQADLKTSYASLVHDTRAPDAFYDYNRKTIAVSLDSVTQTVLAHEIAHAVICSYFNVPPPARMQEILALYVYEHLGDE